MRKFFNSLPNLEQKDIEVSNLMKPVTLKELEMVIGTFKNGKAPGLDGLSIEFYKSNYGRIKHHLLNFVIETLSFKHKKKSVGGIHLVL